ncbi:MAG: hypothetical protein IPN89_10275 [Saprospiraceae bacterium]|nr:hypothetical protein [Saprospiraceae bacterium]
MVTIVSIIRGGTGIFFGRIPMVWPGGVYNNSGALIGGVGENRPTAGWANIPTFNPDINKQYDAGFFGRTIAIPGGELNLISSDFKLPDWILILIQMEFKTNTPITFLMSNSDVNGNS